MKVFFGSSGSHWRISGGKKVGAAVLARTNLYKGIFKLQSCRFKALYLAQGLLEIGQGESVLKFMVTINNKDLNLSDSKLISPPPKVFLNSLSNGDLL